MSRVPIVLTILVGTLLPGGRVQSVPVLAPTPSLVSGRTWSQLYANGANTGRLTDAGVNISPNEDFRAPTRGWDPPLCIGNRIYAVDALGALFAFDVETETVIWRLDPSPGQAFDPQAFLGEVRNGEAWVYAMTHDLANWNSHEVLAVRDGGTAPQRMWTWSGNWETPHGLMTLSGNRLYLKAMRQLQFSGSTYLAVVALNATTGAMAWKKTWQGAAGFNSFFRAKMTVDPVRKHVFVPMWNGLEVLDAQGNSAFQIPYTQFQTWAYNQDTSSAGNIILDHAPVLDGAKRRLYLFQVGPPNPVPPYVRKTRIACFDSGSGVLLWDTDSLGLLNAWGTPVLGPNALYVFSRPSSGAHLLHALDPATGAPIWQQVILRQPRSMLLDGGGTLWVDSAELIAWWFTALEASTGAVLNDYRYSLGQTVKPWDPVMSASGGKLLVMDQFRNVVCFH